MIALRSRRRALFAGAAAIGLVAGYALLASGAPLAAPTLVVTYLALIPAALLA